MKICRDINYRDFGITEENGWTASYNWEKPGKTFRKIDIGMLPVCGIFGLILSKSEIFQSVPITQILLSIGISLLLFLFVLTPIHELLHLIPMTGFKFDNWYILIGKGTVGAFYSGESSKKQVCISLITPLLVLGAPIIVSVVFLSGISKFCAIILLLCHILGCNRDIYMFFYYIKRIPSNTMFYGNRIKAPD